MNDDDGATTDKMYIEAQSKVVKALDPTLFLYTGNRRKTNTKGEEEEEEEVACGWEGRVQCVVN